MNLQFASIRTVANHEKSVALFRVRQSSRPHQSVLPSRVWLAMVATLFCGFIAEHAIAQTPTIPTVHRVQASQPQQTQSVQSVGHGLGSRGIIRRRQVSHPPVGQAHAHYQSVMHPAGQGYASHLPTSPSACDQCGCANSTLLSGGGCSKCMMGVDCATECGAEARWSDMRPMSFAPYGPGGYAGPARLPHLDVYRLRPGDQVRLVYLVTRRQGTGSYRLTPGDEVLIESLADDSLLRGTLERGLQVQPDGTITVRLLGEVQAAGLTVGQLRQVLEKEYKLFYEEPSIDVTPVRTNTLAEDIRSAVAGQGGFNPQNFDAIVMPDGNLRLPGLGSLLVQGFSLDQLKREVNLRYGEIVVGLEVEPILIAQAPHFVTVLGQVNQPNRIQIDTPTTVLGAIAAAGGHLPGGNLRQVVVFRRAEDWRLVSTVLDLNGAALGKRPTPADEIWVQDGDVIIVPDKPIQIFDNWVRQVFVEGIYGVVPFGGFSFSVQENN